MGYSFDRVVEILESRLGGWGHNNVGKYRAAEWLATPNPELGGQTPICSWILGDRETVDMMARKLPYGGSDGS